MNWSAAATRFRDAHDATVARMQDRSISPTQHWPIFAEEVARLTPAATDTGLRAALDAVEHLSHDNPHQFPPAENYRIWMREINARARAALSKEDTTVSEHRTVWFVETPGYVPGATVTTGALLTAVTIATPAETGLDVERLARALVRISGRAGHQASEAWREGSTHEIAVEVAAEYLRALDKEPK